MTAMSHGRQRGGVNQTAQSYHAPLSCRLFFVHFPTQTPGIGRLEMTDSLKFSIPDRVMIAVKTSARRGRRFDFECEANTMLPKG